MVQRDPYPRESQLRHEDRVQQQRQYSYDLTKQLTFFVISAEFVFCGYILLNAQRLKDVGHSSALFLLAGLAAIFGIFWRFTYNEIYHAQTHGLGISRYYSVARTVSYVCYVGLSLIFFVLLLVAGYAYLSGIEEVVRSHTSVPGR